MSLFQLRQTVLLLITATIWGLSFVAQSVGMDHIGPFTFTASRMFLGALVLLPFVLWNRSRLAASNPVEHARRTSPAGRAGSSGQPWRSRSVGSGFSACRPKAFR